MKKLILAEKPSVARDIGRILNANEKKKNYLEGKNYVITWALGHLLGLKMPEDLNKKWEKWQLEHYQCYLNSLEQSHCQRPEAN